MEIQAFAKLNLTLDILGKREDGYHLMDMLMQPVELADELNEKLGVSPIQRQAMEVGSMCGWDAPGADPAKYQEDYVQTGAPAEARHSGFGGERSSGKMSEPCPPDEANDMEHGTTMGGMTLG